MPVGNHPGIFWNKKAKVLAQKYDLDLTSTLAYGVMHGYVKIHDVEFIVHNLWISHFVNSAPKPIQINGDDYVNLKLKLQRIYPLYF